MTDDGFHPNLQQSQRIGRNRVHHVKSSDIDADTAQSEGMERFAAISGRTVGAEKLWMGETHVHPQAASANHHHGESETAIFVLSGHPDFVFHDGQQELRIATNPGDYVFIRFAGWKPLALAGGRNAAFLFSRCCRCSRLCCGCVQVSVAS